MPLMFSAARWAMRWRLGAKIACEHGFLRRRNVFVVHTSEFPRHVRPLVKTVSNAERAPRSAEAKGVAPISSRKPWMPPVAVVHSVAPAVEYS